MTGLLRFTVEAGIARLTFDNPRRLKVLDRVQDFLAGVLARQGNA